MDYPTSIKALIDALKGMPGVGGRSAEKLALWFLTGKKKNPIELAEALVNTTTKIGLCPSCGFFIEEGQPCEACAQAERFPNTLCVLEQASDVLSMSRSKAIQCGYHVLGGKLSPLDGISPEDLNISNLLERARKHCETGEPLEIILALGSDVEAQATCQFIADQLSDLGLLCTITQLAQGLPAGSNLGHADELTLKHALDGRKRVS